MKLFNITFCFLFVLFAALQYNDPDPWKWIIIYLYVAVLCWLASKNRFYPKLYLTGIVVFVGYAVYKIFDQNGLIDWITQHNAEKANQVDAITTPAITVFLQSRFRPA